MDAGVDCGPVCNNIFVDITANDNLLKVRKKVVEGKILLLVDTLLALINKTLVDVEQEHSDLQYFLMHPKLVPYVELSIASKSQD